MQRNSRRTSIATNGAGRYLLAWETVAADPPEHHRPPASARTDRSLLARAVETRPGSIEIHDDGEECDGLRDRDRRLFLLLSLCLLPVISSTSPLALCKAGEGPVGAQCGRVRVLENRKAPSRGDRSISSFSGSPARGPDPEPDPVLYLAGGPGEAASRDRRGPAGDPRRPARLATISSSSTSGAQAAGLTGSPCSTAGEPSREESAACPASSGTRSRPAALHHVGCGGRPRSCPPGARAPSGSISRGRFLWNASSPGLSPPPPGPGARGRADRRSAPGSGEPALRRPGRPTRPPSPVAGLRRRAGVRRGLPAAPQGNGGSAAQASRKTSPGDRRRSARRRSARGRSRRPDARLDPRSAPLQHRGAVAGSPGPPPSVCRRLHFRRPALPS